MIADSIRTKRKEKNISQQQLAEMLYVDRSTVASWETGRRVPDITLIPRIAECLRTDPSVFMNNDVSPTDNPVVIIVDDENVLLSGAMPVLEGILPEASIIGFTRASEAVSFAKSNKVDLVFLDIELGKISGLDLCRELLKLNPKTNVIFLTAYSEYSLKAWDPGACGFLEKPLSEEAVRRQLSWLRHPISPVGDRSSI